MTASIQQKRNKYYIVLNWIEDGERKLKWVGTGLTTTGNNKRKAEQKRVEILREWEEKIILRGNDILFSDYLKQWLEETKHTIAENTYYDYKRTIHNSICPYFVHRKIKLCDLKPFHIQEFYNNKMEHDHVTANTIHHYHANIRKALSFAVKQERIKSNPADKVDLPKKEQHIADYYTAEELNLLLEKAKGTQLETIILLAAWLGLRRGEIVGLKWDCIDFENNTISVVGTITDKGKSGSKIKNLTYRQTTKTTASLRTSPMPTRLAEYLRQLKQQQDERKKKQRNYNHKWDDFVCVRNNGDLIPLEYVSRAFPALCESCGLKRIRLHELRHTNISLLIEQGNSMKEVQEWAGHSNYSTTANIYAHVQSAQKLKLLKSLEEVIF